MRLRGILSKRQELASLALLGLAISAFAILVVAPVTASITNARDSIEADRDRLDTLRTKRVDLAQLETALKDIRIRQAGQPLVIEASNASAAFDKLESIIRSVSQQYNAAINSTRMLRLEDEAGLKAVRAEIDMTVSRSQLTALILALEQAAPMIFVERLRVLAPDRAQGDDQLRMTAAVRTLAAISTASAHK